MIKIKSLYKASASGTMLVLLTALPLLAQTPPKLTANFESTGLKALNYNNVNFLSPKQKACFLRSFETTNSNAVKGGGWADNFKKSYSWVSKNEVLAKYSFGTLRCKYSVSENTVRVFVTLSNTTPNQTIDNFVAMPLMIDYKETPNPQKNLALGIASVTSKEDVPGFTVNLSSASIAVFDDSNQKEPFYLGFWPTGRFYVSNQVPAYGAGQPWPKVDRPIKPGETVSYSVALRFAPPNTPDINIFPEAYKTWAAAHPMKINWPDRRPIGRMFPGGHEARSVSATNPRGWFNDPTLDIVTPKGQKAFRSKMLAYADNTIKNLTSINAQGAIIWDVEGEQFPQITYVGDPRLLGALAPEMDAIADEFFAKFKAADLRIGMTIRPQEIQISEDGSGKKVYTQTDSANPLKTLAQKIRYAQKRWGMSIFYIDSNAGVSSKAPSGIIQSGSMMEELYKLFPHVLLIPEWRLTKSFLYAAPYYDDAAAWWMVPTADYVRSTIHPKAFQSWVIPGVFQDYTTALNRLQSGDIALIDAWYSSPSLVNYRTLLADLTKIGKAPQQPETFRRSSRINRN